MLLVFEQRLGKARLADYALKSAAPERIVEGYGNRDSTPLRLQLHNPMTTPRSN